MSYTHLNISNLSGYIIDNTSLTSDSLRIFIKESIFLPVYLFSSNIDLSGFFIIFNHSITDYIVLHNLHKTPDSISKDASIPKVVTCLL